MGAMKELIMEVEDLVWEAMETGAKSRDDVYDFVYSKIGNVNRQFVYSLIDALNEWPDDNELRWFTEKYH